MKKTAERDITVCTVRSNGNMKRKFPFKASSTLQHWRYFKWGNKNPRGAGLINYTCIVSTWGGKKKSLAFGFGIYCPWFVLLMPKKVAVEIASTCKHFQMNGVFRSVLAKCHSDPRSPHTEAKQLSQRTVLGKDSELMEMARHTLPLKVRGSVRNDSCYLHKEV